MKKAATPFENNGLAATQDNLTNTSVSSQRLRVLQSLRQRQHSSVELRQSGYEIDTKLCPVLDGFNHPHTKVAIYTLLPEPKAV
ncbi:helix-turn-helix domain-containing protein [Deefgea tanakiae]|uniref:Helix-turn-helix domain-containing protein n=1 Tax=Deefgea tanakiae TaxID=2865840 RepID=A0ABX8Z3Z2_9NEIS|nr:helix-turn-helix domain-containing protein [Deefgea tanakiae]QZA77293.1 helix-turn-helix domain-containing protein [Deefgea tanakiae]